MISKDRKPIRRRDFLISAATVAGAGFPALSWGQSRPCPPSSLSVTGGSSLITTCQSAIGGLPALGLLGGGAGKPWTFGQPFRKGDIVAGQFITAAGSGLAAFQADVRNYWSDGSVKFAVLSGIGGTSVELSSQVGIAPTGSIAEPATTASVQFSSPATTVHLATARTNGSMSWTSTTAHRVRSILGPVMSEYHYYSPVSGDNHLAVWWYVRAYVGGAVEVETVVENGWIMVASPGAKSYTPTVTVNGTTRNTPAALTHLHHTRWSRVDWAGTDPAVTPKHDAAYLRATKLVPNYPNAAPTETAYSGMAFTTKAAADAPTPFALGNWRSSMGDVGEDQNDPIGLLPHWEAVACMATDSRAVWNTIGNARGLGRHNIYFRDEGTGTIPRPSQKGYLWYQQGGSASVPNPSGSEIGYSRSHTPAWGFLPYLLTGRWLFLEDVQFGAAYHHFYNQAEEPKWPTSYGRGGAEGILVGETRSLAWQHRQLAHAAAIAYDTTLKTEWQTLWKNNAAQNVLLFTTSGGGQNMANNLGLVPPFDNGNYISGNYIDNAPWQHAFYAAVMGYAWDLEPNPDSTSESNHLAVRNHAYKFPVGMCGKTSSGGWNWRYCGIYQAAFGTSSPFQAYGSFGQMWTAYKALYPSVTDVDTEGTAILVSQTTTPQSGWSTGYPIRTAMALAYAIDHGATGAVAALSRVTGSSTYATYGGERFTYPRYAVEPR